MTYFNDLQFINGSILPECKAVMDQDFPETWSLELITSGKMSYAVDNSPSVIVDRPALFWHSPKHTYQYGAVDDKGWHHHWIQFKGKRGERLIEKGFNLLSSNDMVYVNHPQKFADMFRILISLLDDYSIRSHARSVMLLDRIYTQLLDDLYELSEKQCNSKVSAVAREIEENPLADYDFNKRAKKAGMSYSYFRCLFRKQIGHAPHDYLLLSRMRYAAKLLEYPASQVKDVAFQCGFIDPAQFSRMFKSKIGMSPRHYQNSMPR